MSDRPNEWTLKGFVQHFDFVHHKMLDHKFVWVLGAGASLASGIPLGSDLVDRWLNELHVREDREKTSLEDWATEENLGIKGFEYKARASFYPKVYERRFREYPEEGYAYLENVMADADPSPGYSILAAALAGDPPKRPPRHNAVVTTNFDNLVADALSIYTNTFPFVCGHESLTPFVKVAMRRPVVCKIHRDLLLAPQSDQRSLKRLHEAWAGALRAMFEHYTPLFIGYGGNDDTLMVLLESLDPGDIKGQMIWCYYEGDKPSERIVNVVTDHRGILVPVPDFDLLMVLLGEKMDIGLLDQEISRRAKMRTEQYRHRIQQLDIVEHPEVTAALAATLGRSGGAWVWDQKARIETDPARREAVYRQGIQHCPNSANLHGNFASFLTNVRGDHNGAERFFRKALELDPKSAHHTDSFASFMTNVRGDHDEAERLYRRALVLDPKRAHHAENLAAFMANVRGDHDEAERLYRKAVELDPKRGHQMERLADFLTNVRGDHDEAEQFYRKALKLDPKRAHYMEKLADFLTNVRGDHDEAEQLYRRAFELDPTRAHNTDNLANFLTNVRDAHDEAEQLYRKALVLDPERAHHTNNLAHFLTTVRGDHDEAERLFLKALKLGPKYANSYGNYAAFLLAQGRLDESAAKLEEAKAINDGKTNQLLAELLLYSAILASVRMKDNSQAVEELHNVLSERFPRFRWNFESVLGYSQENISPEEHALYSALAEAIRDAEKVPAAMALLDERSATAEAPSDGKPKPRKSAAKKTARKAPEKRFSTKTRRRKKATRTTARDA